MNKLAAISIIVISLSGCAKSVFDSEDIRCPFVDKGGCQSMAAINEMVNQNQYTSDGVFVKQSVRLNRGARYVK